MCSAFMDSLHGQLEHINQRASLVVTARSGLQRIQKLVDARGWGDLETSGRMSVDHRMRIRLAGTHAIHEAKAALDKKKGG